MLVGWEIVAYLCSTAVGSVAVPTMLLSEPVTGVLILLQFVFQQDLFCCSRREYRTY